MALLIDGYNLLHATGIFGEAGPGTDLHRSRLALLKFLAASINERERAETMIVFDAAGAPPGLPPTISFEGMTARFARRHSNADELIEELLEQHPAPRSLVVVSSDHRVQRAARHRGASFVDSREWYSELRASQRDAQLAAETPAKPANEVTPEELTYWLGEFAVPPADDDDVNPFPPGYADDLETED
jgi:predicted RNA-binding protein with PIN domain